MTQIPFAENDPIQLEDRIRGIFHDWVDERARSLSSARTDRALKEESAKVYQEMWHAFAGYAAKQDIDILKIQASQIQGFLASRVSGDRAAVPRANIGREDLSPRYAWRMLTLIDRVTRFHAKREGKVASPAAREMLLRPEYRYANASHRDPLPEYYDDEQAQRLIDYLTNTDGTTLPASRMQWKALRDQTAVALMLGGGLTPGDVRALKTAGVFVNGGPHPNIPWKLALPGNGNAPARETPLADWAGRQLARWLSVRNEQGIAGEFVFPSTLTGKPLSHTSCYEACKRVLADAGFESDTGGVFKLRHTFALRQLSNGKSERDVAQWLGLLDLNSIAKYRRIVPRHVDLV